MKVRSNVPLNYQITRTAILSGIILCTRKYVGRDDELDMLTILDEDFLVTVQDGKDIKTLINSITYPITYTAYDALLEDVKTRYTSTKTGAALEDFYLRKILIEEAINNSWYGGTSADWA